MRCLSYFSIKLSCFASELLRWYLHISLSIAYFDQKLLKVSYAPGSFPFPKVEPSLAFGLVSEFRHMKFIRINILQEWGLEGYTACYSDYFL